MTQPTLCGFLFEFSGDKNEPEPKVFFRAMLYTTGKSGHIIEGLFLKVNHGQTVHRFDYWMYGETKDLKIGSGVRVRDDGVAFNHHFLRTVPDSVPTDFQFQTGTYEVYIYAKVVNRPVPILLRTVNLTVTDELAQGLKGANGGVLFAWDHEIGDYRGRISGPPSKPLL